jgi:hypothetical protein
VTPAEDPLRHELWGVDIDVSGVFADKALPLHKASILDAIGMNLEAPIYAVDEKFRYIYFNDFYREAMLQVYRVDPALGERAYAAVAQGTRRRTVLGHLRRAYGGSRVVEEVPIPWDKSVRIYEVTYAPIVSGSATTGVTVFGVKVGHGALAKP